MMVMMMFIVRSCIKMAQKSQYERCNDVSINEGAQCYLRQCKYCRKSCRCVNNRRTNSGVF